MGIKQWLVGVFIICASVGMAAVEPSRAEWVHEGQANEGKWNVGVRAGFNVPTQDVLGGGSSTSIGPVVNLQAMYGLNKWIRVGLMLDWDRRSMELQNPTLDLGTMNTVSLLPTIEFRPGRWQSVVPYLSTGIGVNVNSFSEATAAKNAGLTKVSPSNTFAFRLAGGLDFPITQNLALNTEVAWKRNRGGSEINGQDAGAFDASSASLLVGLRLSF